MPRCRFFALLLFVIQISMTGCITKQLLNRPPATCPQPSDEEKAEIERSYQKAQKDILEKYGSHDPSGQFVLAPCSLGGNEDNFECETYQQENRVLDGQYACRLDPSKCSCTNKIMHSLGTVIGAPFALALDVVTSPFQLINWITFRNWHGPSI